LKSDKNLVRKKLCRKRKTWRGVIGGEKFGGESPEISKAAGVAACRYEKRKSRIHSRTGEEGRGRIPFPQKTFAGSSVQKKPVEMVKGENEKHPSEVYKKREVVGEGSVGGGWGL